MILYSTETKEIRKFGLIAFIFFGCLCALGLWMKKPIPIYIFGMLTLLGLGFLVIPTFLKPLYLAWIKIAHVLGKAVTVVMLTMLYYLVITPAALIKRIFGGAPIPAKHDKITTSYWVKRAEPTQSLERFSKRY